MWADSRNRRPRQVCAVREQIGAALGELDCEHRRLLQLRVVEERSYQEIATVLGVTELSARSRVSRALAALRDLPNVKALIESHERAH